MNPCLTVNLDKIAHNTRTLTSLCAKWGIEILGVTKVFSGDERIARVLVENGIKALGDSRLDNIERYQSLPCQKWLVRMPSPSDAKRCVRICDVSLNSELDTLVALDAAASAQGRRHGVVLMADLGDLREGCIDEADLVRCADFVKAAGNLDLVGVGVNLTCFSFVQPDTAKLSRLVELSHLVGAASVVSGGNSATLKLMMEGGIPRGVNQLRLGEGVLFGRERADFSYIGGTANDAFVIEAQVIECKTKPSYPIGTIGVNSYGVRPTFTDKGMRVRAILSMGRQDVDAETMWPVDEGIEVIGASSDHFVIDVTDSSRTYKVGDKVAFRLGYFATMRAFTSSFVHKVFTGATFSGEQ